MVLLGSHFKIFPRGVQGVDYLEDYLVGKEGKGRLAAEMIETTYYQKGLS